MAVATVVNEVGQEVVLVECPLGHPGGKGEVVPAYLGVAECGQPLDKSGKKAVDVKDGVQHKGESCKAILVPQGDREAKAEGKDGSRSVSIDADETLNQPGLPKHSARGTDLRAGDAGRTGADVIRDAQKPRGKAAKKADKRATKSGKAGSAAKSAKKASSGKAAKKGR